MSKYTYYYTVNQNRYRFLANSWKAWADNASLSERDKDGMAKFFKPIARRFGLITEFKDLGVI